jgi:hypothetical protein
MALQFLRDVGIYVPKIDAIKFTAVSKSGTVCCFAKRSSLVAVGCHPMDDPITLLHCFETNRTTFEKTAAAKFAQGGASEITITASDVLEKPRRLLLH